jgi:hypothetical protein
VVIRISFEINQLRHPVWPSSAPRVKDRNLRRGGYHDLRTSVGRKALRDAVNTAAGESDNISDRVRSKKAAMARRGLPNGGKRPYGSEPDHIAMRRSVALSWIFTGTPLACAALGMNLRGQNAIEKRL